MSKQPELETTAAEASENEATEHEQGRHVLMLPLGEGTDPLTVVLPRKLKRFKVMRKMAAGDLFGALEVLGASEDELDKLEDAEVDEKEFASVIEHVGKALAGKKGS